MMRGLIALKDGCGFRPDGPCDIRTRGRERWL